MRRRAICAGQVDRFAGVEKLCATCTDGVVRPFPGAYHKDSTNKWTLGMICAETAGTSCAGDCPMCNARVEFPVPRRNFEMCSARPIKRGFAVADTPTVCGRGALQRQGDEAAGEVAAIMPKPHDRHE